MASTFIMMTIAALLEVGGDALIQIGLKGGGIALMIVGAVVLASYGFMVNLTGLEFGRLMGIYIALFFVVAQLMAILLFHEKVHLPILVGGMLVVAGGLTMACWRAS